MRHLSSDTFFGIRIGTTQLDETNPTNEGSELASRMSCRSAPQRRYRARLQLSQVGSMAGGPLHCSHYIEYVAVLINVCLRQFLPDVAVHTMTKSPT